MKALRSFGFLAMFAPPLLLIAGRLLDFDWLLAGAYFLVFPLLRVFVGSARDGVVNDWSALEMSFLKSLPRIYAGFFLLVGAWVLWVVSERANGGVVAGAGFIMSTLVLGGLAACVAHDLAHRPTSGDRRTAHLISALVGYPFFIFEHLEHHKRSRHTESANCPRIDDNVWWFCGKRFFVVISQVVQTSFAHTALTRRPVFDSVWLYVVVTLSVWTAFIALGGWYGGVLYATLLVGVPFLLNTITYIQHWGLGDDGPAASGTAYSAQLGWDDGCRFQSWVILNISFHDDHHATPSAPYYTYGPTADSPRLPAEYAIMVLVCFVPALWRRVMVPELHRWQSRSEIRSSMFSTKRAA